MASTSAPPSYTDCRRMKSSATTLVDDNQALSGEVKRAVNMMKEIAVDFEKDNRSDEVKELEAGVMELLAASEDCRHLSAATQTIANEYRLGPELTDFKKLLEGEIAKSKAGSSPTSQYHQLLRQFREAVWNVHHAGQPMPGDEQEDIVMTTTQSNILNNKCPLTLKPVTELAEPVRCQDCKHIYEKHAVFQIMKNKVKCPVAGCPKTLQKERVICDSLLLVDIGELREMERETAQPENIEDFTAMGEDD
ncbi:OLC1v1023140C1 [Oldenlandia corymbosa var. corymbosa]|uniref:OLC1v1023140C1 n=1 Tax=Oldenlandia corymbosa var. corymbosa TaxID=529605 RepID=A0AAV1BZB1_OLDCO|nr:OLC1v1023140C1 [Oldenlandia corymbosa var. corymbosa]